MARAIIVGAGLVGYHLAQELSEEGRDIVVVESDAVNAQRLRESLDLMVEVGDGALPSCLERAGIESCEHMIAVSNDDRVNMMACILAHEYGVSTKIARVRNSEYTGHSRLIDRFKIDRVFNSHQLVLNYFSRLIATPDTVSGEDFSGGKILLRAFHVRSGTRFDGLKLAELGQSNDLRGINVLAIVRKDELILPRGQDQVLADDTVYLLTTPDRLHSAVTLVTPKQELGTRIVIHGATPIGIALAKRMERRRQVILLDNDQVALQAASTTLKKTLILESGTDGFRDVWENEVEHAGIFLAVKEKDEDNMLSALMAQQLGSDKVIPIIQSPDFGQTARTAGMDTVVNPKLIAVGEILQYMRRGKVLSVVKIADNRAEVMEVQIEPQLEVAYKSIKDLKLPQDTLIGAIVRNSKAIIARGDTKLLPGDNVMVCALSNSIQSAEDFFSRAES